MLTWLTVSKVSEISSASSEFSDSLSRVKIRSPFATLSPTLIEMAATFPANGAGISIVALSVSRVMMLSFSLTESPTLTRTSIISTASKSPISGNSTLLRLEPDLEFLSLVSDDSELSELASASSEFSDSLSRVKIRSPFATLSPTLIEMAATFPANGAGISIVALSVSRVMMLSFSLTESPTLTRTSIISTASKSPISGNSTFF